MHLLTSKNTYIYDIIMILFTIEKFEVINSFLILYGNYLYYCTISINSAGPVTRDGPAEIMVSATSQSCHDMPKNLGILGSLAPQATKKILY